MLDVDFAEFFHNFFADSMIRKHARADLSPLSPFFDHTSIRQSDDPDFKFMGLRWS